MVIFFVALCCFRCSCSISASFLKKSSINDGGFGVFAAREFSAKEFVTVYLGKKYDVTYRFGDILALPSNFKPNGFQEEYWFGHRINHASGKADNDDDTLYIFP